MADVLGLRTYRGPEYFLTFLPDLSVDRKGDDAIGAIMLEVPKKVGTDDRKPLLRIDSVSYTAVARYAKLFNMKPHPTDAKNAMGRTLVFMT